MPDILTQSEANALIKISKFPQDTQSRYVYSVGEMKMMIPLISGDGRELFFLDLWKGKISLKSKYQTRGRKTIILVRVDLHGAPHRNPDGREVPGNHIHLYQEGFDDKWAYPIDPEKFVNTHDLWQTFLDFMNFCNIQRLNIDRRLL